MNNKCLITTTSVSNNRYKTITHKITEITANYILLNSNPYIPLATELANITHTNTNNFDRIKILN